MSDVSNLSGAELDAAVARAEGRLVEADEPGWPAGDLKKLQQKYGQPVVRWYGGDGEIGGWEPLSNQGSPSTDWSIGGPIIDREQISLLKPGYGGEPEWTAGVNVIHSYDGWEAEFEATGPTPLIAAMRAFVASKGAAS